MRGPKPPPLDLTPRQHELLERLTRRHSAPQQLICRVQIILLAAAGHNNSQISRHVSLDRTQVRLWRRRWLTAAPRLAALEASNPDDPALTRAFMDLLADAPRPGTPPTFSPEQVVQIVALACEDPADSGRPISSWTPRELAAEAVKRDIVPSISARSVGRFLKGRRFEASSDALLAARAHG
jgi:putative transposase